MVNLKMTIDMFIFECRKTHRSLACGQFTDSNIEYASEKALIIKELEDRGYKVEEE